MPDNRKPFFEPVFRGPRFADHALPLRSLAELETYAEFVRAVAKVLFLREFPRRQRVPKGFNDGLRLVLSRVDEGSAVPVLERIAPEFPQPRLFAERGDHFERARDLINRTVDRVANDQGMPGDFPAELLYFFNKFGSSLHEEDSIELRVPGASEGPTYDQRVRQFLVLQREATFEQDVDLVGSVVASDSTKRSFQLKLGDQRVIPCSYTEAQEEEVLTARKEYRSMELAILGVGVFDRSRRLVRVQDIIELATMRSLRSFDERLREIKMLQNGWYDGAGAGVTDHALSAVTVLRGLLDQTDLPLPYLYPTPDGGIQAEWTMASLELQVTFDHDGGIIACWDDGSSDGDHDIPADDVNESSLETLLIKSSLA